MLDRDSAIVEFLTARVAELKHAGGVRNRIGRAIDELTAGPVVGGPDGYDEWGFTIELIASAWYDHPDFNEGWLPDQEIHRD